MTDEQTRATWKIVSWDMQNYIYFYLRSRHFPITIRNTDLVAQTLAARLAAGSIRHRDLEAVIDRSDIEYLLDDGGS